MTTGIRALLLPENQRRTFDELSDDLDLSTGDRRSKRTAFWTMLTLSAVIASAGILSDSTATVIGAMIIAPLSTPIMGIALAIAKREGSSSGVFVTVGAVLVIAIGVVFAQVLPHNYDVLSNSQIASRTSPGLVDMVAALATGLAGAVALARRDVAAVLPGVAIAISLVPPLAVVGVCLGVGEIELAVGAGVLFGSNLLALVLAGTLVFTFLGYAEEAWQRRGRSRRRAYTVLAAMTVVVLLPLVANTVVTYLLARWSATAQQEAQTWLEPVHGASVSKVDVVGTNLTIRVQTPEGLPPTSTLREALADRIPETIGITVVSTTGQQLDVRPAD